MLIVDLKLPAGGVRRVGIVGSCRVITPMQKAIKAGLCRQVWHVYRCYIHSAPEADQLIDVCRGRRTIPDALAPFIFSMNQSPQFKSEWIDLIDSCQTFLIEVSTLEYFRFNDYIFNILGLSNNLVRGNGPGMLSWYRKLTNYLPDPDVVTLAERSLENSGVQVTSTIAEILRLTRQKSNNFSSFGEYIRNIIFDPSKRWIFVPMFNLSERPEERIAARVVLRDLLVTEAAANGAEVFDTTPLVERAGRRAALDNDGTNLTHYARDFEILVGEALCRYMIGPDAASSPD